MIFEEMWKEEHVAEHEERLAEKSNYPQFQLFLLRLWVN